MTLTITGDTIVSDVVPVEARRPGPAGWLVTGYGDRRFDRNQAITAVTLAEVRAMPQPDAVLIASLEAELA
jgi:hypothetical protein